MRFVRHERRHDPLRTLRFTLITLCSAGLLTLGPGATDAQRRDSELDTWLTAKAKVALLTADAGDFSRVSVDTFRGRVTLAGGAPLDVDRSRAIDRVQAVRGVRQVRLLLEQTLSVPEVVPDDTLADEVKQALRNDRVLHDSQVSVESVGKGTVHLTGKATAILDHLHALYLVWGVPGVHAVKSDVDVPEILYTESEAAEWRAAAVGGEARSGPLQDIWITSAVKLLLAGDPRVPVSTVGVDTRDGGVALFGVAAQPEARSAAEAHARTVERVQRVTNDIQVDTRIELAAASAIDSDIAAQLKTDLANYGPISGCRIDVGMKDGIAVLSGSVPTDEHALAATLYARTVPGVRAVRNNLTVESHQRGEEGTR